MKSSLKGFILSHRLTKNAYCDLFKLKMLKRDFDAKPQRAQEKGQAVMLIENMTENKNIFSFAAFLYIKIWETKHNGIALDSGVNKIIRIMRFLKFRHGLFYERDFRERIKKRLKRMILL